MAGSVERERRRTSSTELSEPVIAEPERRMIRKIRARQALCWPTAAGAGGPAGAGVGAVPHAVCDLRSHPHCLTACPALSG
jgi:hypothetical protein